MRIRFVLQKFISKLEILFILHYEVLLLMNCAKKATVIYWNVEWLNIFKYLTMTNMFLWQGKAHKMGSSNSGEGRLGSKNC